MRRGRARSRNGRATTRVGERRAREAERWVRPCRLGRRGDEPSGWCPSGAGGPREVEGTRAKRRGRPKPSREVGWGTEGGLLVGTRAAKYATHASETEHLHWVCVWLCTPNFHV